MEESFSFSPVDRVPDTKGVDYSKLPIDKWNWTHFVEYYNDSFYDSMKHASGINRTNRGRYKSRIEAAMQLWGNKVFRHMIDWLFDNIGEYPEWKDPNINLLCGTHGWSMMIGEQAKKRAEFDDD